MGLFEPTWASMGLPGPPWAYLALSNLFLAYMSLSGPLWTYLAFANLLLAYMSFYEPHWSSLVASGQSPKLPTHPHKKHTEPSHKLPATRLHPEKGTIKNQTQTIKQATEPLHKHLIPCSVCRSLGFSGPPCAYLGIPGLPPLLPLSFEGVIWSSLGPSGHIWPSPAFSWLI